MSRATKFIGFEHGAVKRQWKRLTQWDRVKAIRVREQLSAKTLAPFSRAHETRRLLLCESPPVIATEQKFVMVWSPKSACSTAMIWFFQVIGVADKARAFDNFPHLYRIRVHYPSAYHRNALRTDISDFHILRIIRDPYQRAVSSYRHALRDGFENRRLSAFLGRPVTKKTGCTFDEFLAYLATIDIEKANPHIAQQRHPIEAQRPPTFTVNVSEENLLSRLNAFEETASLPRTDFRKVPWIEQLEHGRKAGQAGYDDDVGKIKFSREEARPGGAWPSAVAFLTHKRRDIIAQIYRTDIDHYL
ncbi:MAG: sulfotransferase family 2 domain-containing protein [Pseudomonadota bacterium]